MAKPKERSVVRSFSAMPREIRMLESVARYHGLTKSGAIRALIQKEFWRIFPAGTADIEPEQGARIVGGKHDGDE